jgi:hypothetical protein
MEGTMKGTVVALTILMTSVAAPALAQHGGGAKPATPRASSQAPKTMTSHGAQAPKAATGGSKTRPAKTTTATPPKTTLKTNTTAKSTKTTTKATTPTATSLRPTTTLTPVQQKLQRNTNLAAKLQSRLPAGTNLQTAAAGFRNLGQFVAAVNVSNNLGIPFTDLKTRMVDGGMSLGQAIQDTRPRTTDTTVIVTRAERDADDMIRTTETPRPKKTQKNTGGLK